MAPSKKSTRRRQRQTQLNFTPVPSSSPAAAHLSPDVRDRAASIGYTGSPSPAKRRKVAHDDTVVGGGTTRATTAARIKPESNSDETDDSDTDDEPVSKSKRSANTFLKSNRAKSQKKISFNQPEEPSPTVENEEDGSEGSVPESGSSSEEIPVRKRAKPATPMVAASKKSKKRKASPDSSRESPPAKRQTRATKRSKKSRKAAETPPDDSDELEIVDKLANTSTRDPDFGEPESSGDDALASSPGSISRKKKDAQPAPVYSEDDESEDIPVSTRKKRAPPSSDSEDEPVIQRSRRRSPSAVQREKDDLAEDLEFLGSSPRKISRAPRKAPPVMNARQRALEALKRRRAGEKEPSPQIEEGHQPRRGRALYDTDSESESGSDQEDEDEEDENENEDEDEAELSDRPRSRVHQASTLDMFQEDAEDESFVVEDDDETIGVPDDMATIPIEFTSISRAKGKDLFKYAVEWMVQKKLNPGFAKKDDIYKLAFRKLDDEVKGLSGSKFKSSSWTLDFTRALNARPQLESYEIGAAARLLLENHCQACNRRAHPATWTIALTGKAYKPDTLSEVEDDDSSDSDGSDDSDLDEEDRRSVDANGNPLPPETTEFHVGVHCKTNAETAHTLEHWRWHLYDWVKDHLNAQGHLDPEKIVERDGWKSKKRAKYANKVVDDMLANGEIRNLWRDFSATIKTAREVKHSRFSR